jgi:hypothetical protein
MLYYIVFVLLQASRCVWSCGEWTAVCDRDGEPEGGHQPSTIRRRQNQQLWRTGANEKYVLICVQGLIQRGQALWDSPLPPPP